MRIQGDIGDNTIDGVTSEKLLKSMGFIAEYHLRRQCAHTDQTIQAKRAFDVTILFEFASKGSILIKVKYVSAMNNKNHFPAGKFDFSLTMFCGQVCMLF